MDVPDEFVEPNLYSRWVPECFFFSHAEGYPGVGRTPKPRAARLQFKSFQGGLL